MITVPADVDIKIVDIILKNQNLTYHQTYTMKRKRNMKKMKRVITMIIIDAREIS